MRDDIGEYIGGRCIKVAESPHAGLLLGMLLDRMMACINRVNLRGHDVDEISPRRVVTE